VIGSVKEKFKLLREGMKEGRSSIAKKIYKRREFK